MNIPFIHFVGFVVAFALIYFGGFRHIAYPPMTLARTIIGVTFVAMGLLVAGLTSLLM